MGGVVEQVAVAMTAAYEGVDEVCFMKLDFGMELILDLIGVDPYRITDEAVIKEFARDLVDLIEMKAYGPPVVEHFGHDNPVTSGYTLVQLIETSSVTAHFSEGNNTAHINVFSCKWFDAGYAKVWIAEFWGAARARYRVIPR